MNAPPRLGPSWPRRAHRGAQRVLAAPSQNHDLWPAQAGGDAAAIPRSEAGLLLRRARAQWRLALALACALRVPPAAVTAGCESSDWAASAQVWFLHVSPDTLRRSAGLTAARTPSGPLQECQIAAAEAAHAAAARAAPAVEVYSALASRIDALGLDGVWDAKPLLNGPEVKPMLLK